MYQVSEALDGVISGSGRTFYARLNDVQTGIQRITQTSMSTPDSYMYVGSAISSKIEVSMYTKSNSFKNGAELKFEIGASTGDTIEWIPMGYFTIQDSKKDRDLLTFTAYDRIGSLLGKTYICKLSYPSESKAFLTDISNQTGIQFDMSGLTGEYMIDKIPSADNAEDEDKTYTEPFEGFTMQQVVGYIAQLHGKFAVCDRGGKVVFRWYKKIKMASEGNRILDNRRIPVRDQLGDMLYDSVIDFSDDGRLKSTAADFILDQDSFFIYDTLQYYAAAQTYIVKSNRYFDDLVKESSKFEVTGIGCQTENAYITSGESTGLVLESPVMEQEWLDKILAVVKQLSFYPASFSFMGDPRIDVGDIIVVIDADGNPIDVPIMEHVLDFDGGLLSEVASYGADVNEAQSPSSAALDRTKGDIEATYARLDKVNIKEGWITTAIIGDAQITNAKIKDLSADKLTAGTIDANIITIKNLHLSDVSDTGGISLDATLKGITTDISNKYTELDGKISDNAASISLLPDSITSTVKKSYIDPLDTRVSGAETDISNAEKRITQAEKDIVSAKSSITQTSSSITADVEAKYKELDGKISTNTSSIGLLPDSISASVKKSYIDPLDKRMTTAEASIKLNAESIESKVSKGSIISTINQSAEKITISANKIDFNGSTTFTTAVKNASDALTTANNLSKGLTDGTTGIKGDCIKTGTIWFGTESYINKNGKFRIGPMYSTGGSKDDRGYYSNQDVCFDKAIMINYGIEIYGNNDSAEGISYIDFHSGSDVTTGDKLYDYTGRFQNYLAKDGVSQFAFTGSKTVEGTSAGTCTVAVNGTLVHSSDRRLKDSILDIDYDAATEWIMDLRPVSYVYKADANKKVHHGLIYQEVQECAQRHYFENLAMLQEFRGTDKVTYGAISYEELIADIIRIVQKHERILRGEMSIV